MTRVQPLPARRVLPAPVLVLWLSAPPGRGGAPPVTGAGTDSRSSGCRERRRVLVVDDDRGFREALAAQLEMLHAADVAQARNGAEALAMVKREQGFHLILIDVSMPGLYGPEVCRRLRNAGITCRIALMSAKSDAETRARAEALGTPLLDKGFPRNALQQLLSCEGNETA